MPDETSGRPDNRPLPGSRAARLNAIGIPAAEADDAAQWSEDVFTATTTDMADGHPLKGRSPWPATP